MCGYYKGVVEEHFPSKKGRDLLFLCLVWLGDPLLGSASLDRAAFRSGRPQPRTSQILGRVSP